MDEIGRAFLRATAYGADEAHEPSDQQKGLPQPPLEWPCPPEARRVALPAAKEMEIPSADLREVLEGRRSVRRYTADPLTLTELSWLLWATQGVQTRSERHTLRTVPSAGARHPFETVILANRVEGLEPGLWRYLALSHELAEYDLATPQLAEVVTEMCLGQSFVAESAATFLWICDAYRTRWRYPERGWRLVFVDVGHVCQNLYLAAEAIGCGCCAILAFGDPQMNELLRLDGEERFLAYVATVGRKP